MKVLRSMDDLPEGLRFALTIGVFDGVHRGHQRALRILVESAERDHAEAVVLTFDPHPSKVLGGSSPPLLCAPDERLARIADIGVQTTIVQRFDEAFADQPPEEFLARLCNGRQLVTLVMSTESAFGRDRAGGPFAVKKLGRDMGFRVMEVPQLRGAGGALSSTRLRGLLAEGRLSSVRRLLGRDYAVTGEVVRGDQRGRDLGYPTANLGFAEPVALPTDGIYAVRASWRGDNPLRPERRADGVASLGVRPTFGGGDRTLEVYLFDIDEDLYGERLRVEFVRRLRGEKKFASAQALVAQMDRDADRARAALARNRQSGFSG